MGNIAARSRDYRNRSAAVGPVFGRGGMSQDSKLLDGVDRGADSEAAVHAIHIPCAIQQVIVRFGSLAIDRKGLTRLDRSTSRCESAGKWRHACLKQSELGEVAAIQR